jgi:hypothetical protein
MIQFGQEDMDGCHQRTYNLKRLDEKKEQLKY